MPLYKKITFDDGLQLALWKIEETEAELRSLISMNAEEENELDCIKAPQSRLRWLASRLALKSLFEKGIPVEIKKDMNGKPFFKILNGHLSLSHSGEFATCLYHPEKRVGIDIEFIRPKIFDIRAKFMKVEELSSIPIGNAKESLFVCWCAKEAIYKWQGNKGVSMKDRITVYPFTYEEKGQLTADLIEEQGVKSLLVNYERIEDYMLAYVSND